MPLLMAIWSSATSRAYSPIRRQSTSAPPSPPAATHSPRQPGSPLGSGRRGSPTSTSPTTTPTITGSTRARHSEETLRALGLTPYGPLEEVAITPVWRDERMTLVGIVGFATYPHAYNLLDITGSAAMVSAVRPLVDVLVVTFHGGAEGTGAVRVPKGAEFLGKEPRGNLRRWARIVLDAGADAVVGHGPHVLRGVEFYQGKPIFYSLGNFLTYRGFNLDGPLGLTTVLQLELDSDGHFLSASMPPLIQVPQVGPAPDSTGRTLKLLRRITKLDFPTTGAVFGPDGVISPP